MSSFLLRIITPDGEFYAGDIEYLCAETDRGKQGFLHGALPCVALLKSGCLDIKTSVLQQRALCGDGLLCVKPDGVTVLTERCAFEGDAPVEHAENSRAVEDSEYKTAKVKLASSIKKMREKGGEKI